MELFLKYNHQLKERIGLISTKMNGTLHAQEFNTSQMLQYAGYGTERQCPVWGQLWTTFMNVPSPVIYWFDIISDTDPQEVYDLIKYAKETLPDRYFPSIRSNTKNPISKTLYVGSCSSTLLRDRLFWHSGYYRVGRTQGLQLCHWARSIDLTIRISAFVLPPEAKELTLLYENELARYLIPIVGKH